MRVINFPSINLHALLRLPTGCGVDGGGGCWDLAQGRQHAAAVNAIGHMVAMDMPGYKGNCACISPSLSLSLRYYYLIVIQSGNLH